MAMMLPENFGVNPSINYQLLIARTNPDMEEPIYKKDMQRKTPVLHTILMFG